MAKKPQPTVKPTPASAPQPVNPTPDADPGATPLSPVPETNTAAAGEAVGTTEPAAATSFPDTWDDDTNADIESQAGPEIHPDSGVIEPPVATPSDATSPPSTTPDPATSTPGQGSAAVGLAPADKGARFVDPAYVTFPVFEMRRR